jgi:FKBP-type peptidyl-prolyl cis-trans isomerase SlpA
MPFRVLPVYPKSGHKGEGINGVTVMQYAVDVGSKVTLHLSLTLEDGTVAESTFEDEPLTFTMGDGTLVHGLELALYGLRPGDTQRLALYPEQAFGPYDPERVHRLPRSGFPADIELTPGNIITFDTPEGEEIAGTLLSLDDRMVEVDLNHPLAGCRIVFDVEILDVVPANME